MDLWNYQKFGGNVPEGGGIWLLIKSFRREHGPPASTCEKL